MQKILIIEDEAALQKALGDVLTQEGFETFSALDGEVGLRLAQENTPDLILLDLVLPKMNGFEVLGKLKEDASTQDVPVIVLTNLEEMKDIEKVVDLGASSYLVKSNYKLQEVVERIRKTLQQ
jgi:DNA-binding response OmpR family regulator